MPALSLSLSLSEQTSLSCTQPSASLSYGECEASRQQTAVRSMQIICNESGSEVRCQQGALCHCPRGEGGGQQKPCHQPIEANIKPLSAEHIPPSQARDTLGSLEPSE